MVLRVGLFADSSCGALICPTGPESVALARGALIRLGDPPRRALICPSVTQGQIHSP